MSKHRLRHYVVRLRRSQRLRYRLARQGVVWLSLAVVVYVLLDRHGTGF